MTVTVCDHQIIYENYATPTSPNKMRYRVAHPQEGSAPIEGHEIYTAEEVNQMLVNLRNELMAEIEQIRNSQSSGMGPD